MEPKTKTCVPLVFFIVIILTHTQLGRHGRKSLPPGAGLKTQPRTARGRPLASDRPATRIRPTSLRQNRAPEGMSGLLEQQHAMPLQKAPTGISTSPQGLYLSSTKNSPSCPLSGLLYLPSPQNSQHPPHTILAKIDSCNTLWPEQMTPASPKSRKRVWMRFLRISAVFFPFVFPFHSSFTLYPQTQNIQTHFLDQPLSPLAGTPSWSSHCPPQPRRRWSRAGSSPAARPSCRGLRETHLRPTRRLGARVTGPRDRGPQNGRHLGWCGTRVQHPKRG